MKQPTIKHNCKNCNRKIEYDLEGDLIHTRWENKGVDSRLCEPMNPDSKIAEACQCEEEGE